jgi:hypothetical protein
VRVILLGPQRRPTVDAVVRSLSLAGPIATITAGWQEREPDDAELSTLLGGRTANLSLYRRWLDVQDRDPQYAAAERALAGMLAELQDLYLLRLDYALQAVYAVQRRSAREAGAADELRAGELRDSALAEAVAAVRELDVAHLHRVDHVRSEFFQRLQPHDRPVIAGHRAEVQGIFGEACALVIAGGHVGVLAEVLHLFNVTAALRSWAGRSSAERSSAERSSAERSSAERSSAERSSAERSSAGRSPVIAWSAGAMALADRIVLFGDRSPQGPGHPEVYGSGLSVLRDVVLLPHARARMLLDDTPRMAAFARRFAPARCVLLDSGTRIELDGDDGYDVGWPPGVRMIAEDGRVISLEAA